MIGSYYNLLVIAMDIMTMHWRKAFIVKAKKPVVLYTCGYSRKGPLNARPFN